MGGHLWVEPVPPGHTLPAPWALVCPCVSALVPLDVSGNDEQRKLKILPLTGRNKTSLSPSGAWVPYHSNTMLNSTFILHLEVLVKQRLHHR